MISNSNFTVPGVSPPPAHAQAIPEESGIAIPTLPDSQTLPSNPDEIHPQLAYHKKENECDAGLDFVDLHRDARRVADDSDMNNDVQMIEVLQVGKEEMPEAIKTLQRALEREREKENVGGVILC
jgi:abelson tyrosine-protein kinase 1